MILHKITDGKLDDSAAAGHRKKLDRMVVITVLLLLAAVIVVGVMFGGLISSYRSSTAKESAAHLTEINEELRLYVETEINEFWNAAHGIASSVRQGNIGDDVMLDYLASQRDIYAVSDIALFTQSGYAVNADGSVLANDVASETVARIFGGGESLTIQESTVVYTVSVDTNALYHGSEIVAVSVVQDLDSFLDKMGITPFGGAGLLYLTDQNGVVISKLTRPDSDRVFNLLALLEESEIRPLSDNADDEEDLLASEGCAVFLRDTDAGEQYVVASPIQTGADEMRLFYFVPERVVNQTADSFSRYIFTLSVVVILVFTAGAVAVFVYLYNSRTKQFDKDISVREHMLELLVQNSKSAFALFEIGQSEPRFYSGNCERIFGEACHNLEKTDDGYRMSGCLAEETEALREINAQMLGWDGKHEFRSTFLRNAASPDPCLL